MPVVVEYRGDWLAGFLSGSRCCFVCHPPMAYPRSPSLSYNTLAKLASLVWLVWIMVCTGMSMIPDGILLAVMIWLGLVAAVAGHMFAFRSPSLRFFATTAGSVLFALLVIGTVLGALIR